MNRMISPELGNAGIIPIIECGIANIKLGIFTRLCKAYQRGPDPERATPLAYCVVRHIFSDPLNQATLEHFARDNANLIAGESQKALLSEDLRQAVALAYAVRIIEVSWHSGNPDDINRIVEKASDKCLDIPNIVQEWGSNAFATFFTVTQDFLADSL